MTSARTIDSGNRNSRFSAENFRVFSSAGTKYGSLKSRSNQAKPTNGFSQNGR